MSEAPAAAPGPVEAGARSLALRRLVLNPLIVKDGLSRVRTWRAPAVIALYLVVLGLVAWMTFAEQLGGYRGTIGFARVGGNVFTALAMVQLALVCLFTPGVAAGAVSGERERQTLDVLLVSGVPSFGIVWGKLVASVAFVLLLILAALPLFATVFLFGGIDAQQFVVTQLLTVTTALATAAVSLFLSTALRRTLAATVVAYGLTFLATAGSWVVGTAMTLGATSQRQAAPGTVIMYLNPINAMLTILRGPGGIVTRPSVVLVPAGPGLVPVRPLQSLATAAQGLEPWHVTVLAQLVLVAIGVLATVLLLRERRRPGLD